MASDPKAMADTLDLGAARTRVVHLEQYTTYLQRELDTRNTQLIALQEQMLEMQHEVIEANNVKLWLIAHKKTLPRER